MQKYYKQKYVLEHITARSLLTARKVMIVHEIKPTQRVYVIIAVVIIYFICTQNIPEMFNLSFFLNSRTAGLRCSSNWLLQQPVFQLFM